jgi:hypothetical protein
MLSKKIFESIIVFLGMMLCASGFAENVKYDAIYNHDFSMNMTGWGNWPVKGAFKEVKMRIRTTQMADVIEKELIVNMKDMPEGAKINNASMGFEVYSNFKLHPEAGKTYTMVLTAKGKGCIRIGAIEYGHNKREIHHNLSGSYNLTNEYKSYKFEYTPSPGTKNMCPSIGFYLPENTLRTDVDASIKSFSLPVSEKDYKVICKEQLKDGMFSFKGFSAKELEEIKQTAIVDMVLPPFKPIQKTGEKNFKLTTSEITLGKNGLPEKVNVLGQDIISKGIRLKIVYSDGTELNLYPVESSVKSSEQKIILRQEFKSKDKRATLTCELNYDAFMVYKLALNKTPGADITDVSLIIPFAPGTARYIRYSGKSGKRFGSAITDNFFGFGPIPGKGERVITTFNYLNQVWNDWRPFIPDSKANGIIWEHQNANLPYIWIGDDKRGMALMCWTNQGHHHENDKVPAVSLSRNKDEVSLNYNFINGKVSLEKERIIQFVLAVTPAKPVPKNWFDLRMNNGWCWAHNHETNKNLLPYFEEYRKKYAGSGITAKKPYNYSTSFPQKADILKIKPWSRQNNRKYRDIVQYNHKLWSYGCSSPLVKYPEEFKACIKHAKDIGQLIVPYMAATHLAATDKNCFYYAVKKGEWLRTGAPISAFVGICPNSESSEYIAHGIGKLIDEYGIEGIYFDNAFLGTCSNTKHGCGFRDDKGVLRKTWTLLGMRKLFMMTRHEFVKRGKEPFIYVHADIFPGQASFVDATLFGEGIYGSDYTEMISLGEWRAHFLGQDQLGVVQFWCPNFHMHRPENISRKKNLADATRTFLTMAVLHGTKIHKTILDTRLLHRLWNVYDELEGEVNFIPYWHWSSINRKLNLRDVYATAYSQGNRILLAVSNLSKTEQKVSIPLAEVQKKNRAVKNVADNLHKKPVAIKNNNIIFTIPAKDFRLLSLY